MNRQPEGFRAGLSFSPEVEANLSGLPLSDVLTDRARALELRQVWAEARARDMLADAIAEMDRLGALPEDFERREDDGTMIGGRRWADPEEGACGKCRGAGCDRCHGGRGEGWRL